MDIIELRRPVKTLGEAGRRLGLPERFAAPAAQPETIALLTQHIDQLRERVAELEAAEARRNQSCFAWLRERFRR